MKFKMRKIKSHLRWCKKSLEKYYSIKIYKLSFPKVQLKLMFDFIQQEKRISKMANHYYINKIKIKKETARINFLPSFIISLYSLSYLYVPSLK